MPADNNFKEIREKRGISPDEVCRALKISRKALNALECGDAGFFPAPFYFKSFAKNYCAYLGIPADGFISAGHKHEMQKGKNVPNISRTVFVRAVFVSLVAFLIFAFWFLKRAGNSVAVSQVKNSDNLSWASDASFLSTFEARALTKHWLEVTADGILRFEGFLPEGKTLSWRASNNFKISAIDSTGIEFYLDNRKIEPVFDRNLSSVISVTFVREMSV